MTPARLAAVLLGAAATAALAAGSAQARDRCALAGTQTLRSTPLVRVYDDSDRTGAFVCLRASGRRTALYDDDGLYSTGAVAAVAGHFVAFAFNEVPACKDLCPPGVTGASGTAVANAATGRVRSLEAFVVAKVVLAASGAVAWLSPPSPGFGIRTLSIWDAAGRRRLDQGQIAPASLRRSGGRLRWTKGTAARSVRMP